MKFSISRHARQEMKRRGISAAMLHSILERPQQVLPLERGKKVYQSQIDCGDGKIFLVRVIVAERLCRPSW